MTAIDTPARIAIIGAGPIGLEATLYARFLGYEVTLFEASSETCHAMRQWDHVRVFTPFKMNASPLGVSAIQCQDASYTPPSKEAFLTGQQFLEQYLDPLANIDLIRGSLQLNKKVLSVFRPYALRTTDPQIVERAYQPFQILTEDANGDEELHLVEAVLDCSGTFDTSNWIGQGGAPACGERRLRDKIEYRLPNVLEAEREKYLGKHTLVVGGGYSAATNISQLVELAQSDQATRITWLTLQNPTDFSEVSETSDGEGSDQNHGVSTDENDGENGEPEACQNKRTEPTLKTAPLGRITNDSLESRDTLAAYVNKLALDPAGPVTHVTSPGVESLDFSEARKEWTVLYTPPEEEESTEIVVDQIIANVGFRPDHSLSSELRVHLCYATEGPMRLAAALQNSPANNNAASDDCLVVPETGAETLITTEPDFYIIGSKSYGRSTRFLLQTGLHQIRDLFTLLGDDPELDLYATMPPLE